VQTRDIARGLNPVELDSSGLMAALQELARRPHSGTSCRLECRHPVLFPDAEAALHAYRIAQEAVANATKHAAAREIVVRLSEDEQSVFLQIADDGVGFTRTPDSARGLGLESMKYRAHAMGGRIWFDTPSGGGTSVTCALPKRK
jgi:signal transduction histidine kinase